MIFNVCITSCLNKWVTYRTAYLRWRYLTVRDISTQITKSLDDKQSQKQYVKVFEMPLIRICRAISRLKLYHTAISALLIPPSIYIHYINLVDNAHIAVASVGIAGCLVFFSTSIFVNNLIGSVYVDEAIGSVKLSYIGFWGQRIDIVCPTSDIVPLTNQPFQKKLLKLSTVQRYSSTQILKIATEHGIILQPHAFDEVFFRVSTNIQIKNPPHPEDK